MLLLAHLSNKQLSYFNTPTAKNDPIYSQNAPLLSEDSSDGTTSFVIKVQVRFSSHLHFYTGVCKCATLVEAKYSEGRKSIQASAPLQSEPH